MLLETSQNFHMNEDSRCPLNSQPQFNGCIPTIEAKLGLELPPMKKISKKGQLQSSIPSIPEGCSFPSLASTHRDISSMGLSKATTRSSLSTRRLSSNANVSESTLAPCRDESVTLTPSLAPSWKLSDFEFSVTVGTGTFGRVRLAKRKETEEYYAVKCIKKEKVLAMKQVKHIVDERQIMISLSHPFIVRLFATFQDMSKIYMVQEFVQGGEMFSHLRSAGRFPNDVAKFYHAELVLAFEYLHSMDIIYRDLKPENLLLDNKGHVKITDFGFAKRVPDRTFTLCGTPEYLAPEVIQSKGHGKAVDWWTMGILLYEFIAGYPPFVGDAPFRTYEKILAGVLRFPSWFSSSSKVLIRGLLQVNPTKRLGSVGRTGVEDIKNSKFFNGADWKRIYECDYTPPIKINVKKKGDTRNFEKYRESLNLGQVRPLTSFEQAQFKCF